MCTLGVSHHVLCNKIKPHDIHRQTYKLKNIFLKSGGSGGPGKIVQRLKVLAAPAEDPSLFPAPYQAAHNSCNFSFLPASIGTQTHGTHSLRNRQAGRQTDTK